MCGATLPVSPWVRVASFWLALCFTLVQVPATAQSKPSEPTPQESSQSILSLLSNQTDDLVARLTLRVKQTDNSEINFRRIIEDYEARWILSEAGWEKSRKDHEATLNELSLSKADFENYVKSSADRAKVDNDAVTTLTRERDDARGHEVLVGAGGVLFGLGLWELAHLFGWIP